MKRLRMLRLDVSHTQLYRKLTEFRHDYDHRVTLMKEPSATEASSIDDDQKSSNDSHRNSSPD